VRFESESECYLCLKGVGRMALTPAERVTLGAVCETLVPGAGAAMPDRIADLLATTGDPADLAEFRQALALLRSPVAGALLHGRFSPFHRLGPAEREAVLRRWATHPVPKLRQAFQAFKRLTGFLWATDPESPVWAELGYSGADCRSPATPLLRVEAGLSGDAFAVDAVVIGSGAGGGVAAAELARRGLHVMVLEKGSHCPEGELGGPEAVGMENLYLDRGMTATRDLSVAILAGSTVGGGTLVNWTACIAPPDWLREEWERQYGLEGLTSPAFQRCVDEVQARLGVHTGESASLPLSSAGRLLEGCRVLGYRAAELPRNVAGCGEDCGFCTFGCRTGAKQSTARTYLADAAEHGARVIAGAEVRRVLVSAGRVTGVEAVVEGRAVTIRAPRVVLAAGALGTPAILLRSGLQHSQIGRNLHLHPVMAVLGRYAEAVRPWSGRLLPAYSNQFAQLDGNYGFLLEVAPAHPGLGALATPWDSGEQYRRELGGMGQVGVFIVLVRDKGSGRVTLDRHGHRRIDYPVSGFDRRHLLRGQQEAIRVHAAAGARQVVTLHSRYNALADSSPAAVAAFAEASARVPSGPNQVLVFSAHQMGTCRMGGSREAAVADPHGQVWGVQGLYVADASAFPAASGVNPMITIMSLANWVAKGIV
jgi:choline dehydrogenase-like flavoprotein